MTEGDRTGDWLAQFMTTEHFTLMSARSSSVSEANGRAALYLATLSSSIVALALVAQISKIGTIFYVFAFVLLPMVFFLGVVTFERTLQSTTEYFIYLRSINRIRGFYAKTVPEIEKYFIMPPTDDPAATLRGVGIGSRWQRFLTLAGTIAIINCLVAAVLAGLVAGVVLDRITSATSGILLAASAAVGAVIFAVVAMASFSHQSRVFRENYGHQVPTMFPSAGGASPSQGYPVKGVDRPPRQE